MSLLEKITGKTAEVSIERTGGISLREERFLAMLQSMQGGLEHALSLLKMGADSCASTRRRLEALNREMCAKDTEAMGRQWRSLSSLSAFGFKLASAALHVSCVGVYILNPGLGQTCSGVAQGVSGIGDIGSAMSQSTSSELQSRSRLEESLMQSAGQDTSRETQEAEALRRSIEQAQRQKLDAFR